MLGLKVNNFGIEIKRASDRRLSDTLFVLRHFHSTHNFIQSTIFGIVLMNVS